MRSLKQQLFRLQIGYVENGPLVKIRISGDFQSSMVKYLPI